MGSSVSFLVGAGVMWTLSLLVGGTIISSASCSRVVDDEDPTSRFNHYDEMMYNDYEGQDPGGEWNSYSPVSNDMYMGGNGNGPQQKFGHSSLHDGPDDPFFNNFLKGQEPGKIQQQAQPQRPQQQQQQIRPPQPQQQQITVAKKSKKPVIATSEKQRQSKKIREF